MKDSMDWTVFLWALLIGAAVIAFQILYVKWRNSSVKLKAAGLLSSIGFSKGNAHHDYLKTSSQYTFTLNHISKQELFDKHRLRIGVCFEVPWEYDVMDGSLAKLRKEYADYSWSAGLVYYDVYYILLNTGTIARVNFRIDETKAILKKHGLNPIDFTVAQEQYFAIEKWRKND